MTYLSQSLSRTASRAILASALLAAFSLPSFAQQTPATPAPAAAAKHASPAPEQRAKWQAQHQERMQKRLDQVKAELKLTPAQENAWSTYAAALKPAERGQRMERQAFSQLTTPQRIDKMRELRTQHAAEAERRGEATKAFYAQLNAEQQKTFDKVSLKAMGKHRRGGHNHGHRAKPEAAK
ncbi:Spy/CpxP family protein refolding chaperone [Comamonas composti]|uniref:Spy/CpxP family protein refolding chaperone n=1 Tax=Comamonas composti TaxID=408558 RepID=UPI0003FFD414|nr:Spy/CpxP family protein refolding chaperone [Comamonas composti]